MPTWEYLIVADADVRRLGELGGEGWELVAVAGEGAQRQLYLKRPAPSLRERVTLEQRDAYYASRHGAPSGRRDRGAT